MPNSVPYDKMLNIAFSELAFFRYAFIVYLLISAFQGEKAILEISILYILKFVVTQFVRGCLSKQRNITVTNDDF